MRHTTNGQSHDPVQWVIRAIISISSLNLNPPGVRRVFRLNDLRVAVGNLIHDFGGTERLWLALSINVSLGLIGLAVWWAAEGWISYLGFVWALLHGIAIARWAVRSG